jgi:hypothetical protein
MAKQLIKYIVVRDLSGDHGENEGCEHLAAYDSPEQAINYIKHSRSFKSLRVVEIPYVLEVKNNQFAEYGIPFYYDLKTKEGRIHNQDMFALDDFNVPKIIGHQYWSVFAVKTVLSLDEEDKFKKAKSIFEDNKVNLIDQIGQCFTRIIQDFIDDNVLEIVIDYDLPEISIRFKGFTNLVIVPKCMVNPCGWNSINKTFKAYKENPSDDTVKLAYDAILKAVNDHNPTL